VGLWSWLAGRGVDGAEVRSEIWRLGVRYRGEPLDGAMEELRAADVSPERTRLLWACVRKLQSR
jgi:hypothetical protein